MRQKAPNESKMEDPSYTYPSNESTLDPEWASTMKQPHCLEYHLITAIDDKNVDTQSEVKS